MLEVDFSNPRFNFEDLCIIDSTKTFLFSLISLKKCDGADDCNSVIK